MPRLTETERMRQRLKLLRAIKNGQPHTHNNSVLAPLAQADLITYDYPEWSRNAINVKLTVSGESYLEFWTKELEIPKMSLDK
jgi:hypothetical protein